MAIQFSNNNRYFVCTYIRCKKNGAFLKKDLKNTGFVNAQQDEIEWQEIVISFNNCLR